jgi:hypothetical protein
MDADVVFLKSPQVLFDSSLFREHGALFFHDRTLFQSSRETIAFFKSIMPNPPSKYSRNLRSKLFIKKYFMIKLDTSKKAELW